MRTQIFWISLMSLVLLFGCASGDWKNAREEDTIHAYNHFIRKHPNSKYTREARERRRELSDLKEELHARNEELQAWNTAKSKAESLKYPYKAYEKYLREYPNGRFASEARERHEKLLFDYVSKNSNLHSDKYEWYLREYPNGRFASEVREKREKLMFDKVLKHPRIIFYERYLKEYPNGRFAEQVRSELATFPKLKAQVDYPRDVVVEEINGVGAVMEELIVQKNCKYGQSYSGRQNISIKIRPNMKTTITFPQLSYFNLSEKKKTQDCKGGWKKTEWTWTGRDDNAHYFEIIVRCDALKYSISCEALFE